MVSTLHVMRQQPQLHVAWHMYRPQRRMQGQGLNCISHVIFSLQMDHDQNERLGLHVVLPAVMIPVVYTPPKLQVLISCGHFSVFRPLPVCVHL